MFLLWERWGNEKAPKKRGRSLTVSSLKLMRIMTTDFFSFEDETAQRLFGRHWEVSRGILKGMVNLGIQRCMSIRSIEMLIPLLTTGGSQAPLHFCWMIY